MSSPFRSQHLFTPNNSKTKSICSPPNTPFSIPASRDYIDFDHGYNSEDSTDGHLFDISDVDYEATRKDYESRVSSNPDKFNVIVDVPDDRELDIYGEVDYLYENPEIEIKWRKAFGDEQLVEYVQEKSQPTQNHQETRVTNTTDRATVLSLLLEIIMRSFAYNNKMTTTSSKKKMTDTVDSNPSENQLKESSCWKLTFFKALKPIVLLLFMIYWILGETISQIATFITLIVSFSFIDSLLSLFSNDQKNPARNIKVRQLFTSFITFIVLIYCFTFLLPSSKNKVHNFVYDGSIEDLYGHQEHASNYLASLKNTFEVISNEHQDIWNKLKRIESHDIKNIWNKIDQHQNEIGRIKASINDEFGAAIESKLPDSILVRTNKAGKLELPVNFYTYLKDAVSWDRFLEHNEKSINKYTSNQMNRIHQNHVSKGTIIIKEEFMKLLMSTLHNSQIKLNKQQHPPLEKVIETLAQEHYQDILNTPDFALESRGARVVIALTSPTYYVVPLLTRLARRLLSLHDPFTAPQMAIMPNSNVGECWTMLGDSGHLGIKLSEPLMVQEITLEYPSSQLMLGDMTYAPKQFDVYGIADYRKNPHDRDLLGNFTYDIHGPISVQTFSVDAEKAYTHIFIRFNSNWGSLIHTDIYRVRVHGTPVRNLR
ncbi:hypothetical protein INT47_008742 [Mucor saturninus]|uniref:SUN domain-containing protein n=1 Tax=Mucor saturninus TaxID=64648 RepID=A0A8H7RJG3_9FUNG|nr:hypothetical protein INT47_008742 [Mucor saturninus]